ncbi:MAG: hypothetical protein C0616_13810 [Desulfuromonas sp.]|nr:MAG: hypothetical protein C0616_13810 [Desulfuromonas sp.]
MTERLLEQIVQLENGLQHQLEQETERAAQWCDRELEALDRQLEEIRGEVRQQDKEVVEREKVRIREEAKLLEAKEGEHCRRLSSLPDADLRRVLRSHLTAILPEPDHDHPDGKS